MEEENEEDKEDAEDKRDEADRDLQAVSIMILPPQEEDRFMMHDIVSNIHLVFI